MLGYVNFVSVEGTMTSSFESANRREASPPPAGADRDTRLPGVLGVCPDHRAGKTSMHKSIVLVNLYVNIYNAWTQYSPGSCKSRSWPR